MIWNLRYFRLLLPHQHRYSLVMFRSVISRTGWSHRRCWWATVLPGLHIVPAQTVCGRLSNAAGTTNLICVRRFLKSRKPFLLFPRIRVFGVEVFFPRLVASWNFYAFSNPHHAHMTASRVSRCLYERIRNDI